VSTHPTHETFGDATEEYSFDPKTGMISIISGPMAGVRYARVSPMGESWTENGWRYLDENHELTA
jgi:hypothetical protein